MISSKSYNGPEVDIWSLGVVLFSMKSNRFPFCNTKEIINCDYIFPEDFSLELKDLISKIFILDSSKRC